jgi:hypothetical protein
LSGHPNCSDSDKRFGSLPNKKKFKFWEELKMKNFTVICFLVVLGAGSAAFAATTSQTWYFNTNDPMPPMPDVVDNAFGAPFLMVDISPAGGWIDGAWALSGEIDVVIPNDPTLRDEKKIEIWLTWQAGDLTSYLPSRPLVGVSADPMTGMEMLIKPQDPIGDWNVTLYDITIRPNPASEWIAIKGNILVDQLTINTECIPEPATMGLLGLGSLALLRNRRKRS